MQSIKIRILLAMGGLLTTDILVGTFACAAFPAKEMHIAVIPAILIGIVISIIGTAAAIHAGRVEEKILSMNS